MKENPSAVSKEQNYGHHRLFLELLCPGLPRDVPMPVTDHDVLGRLNAEDARRPVRTANGLIAIRQEDGSLALSQPLSQGWR